MPSVAIIGTRGYPSYYGGFETAVRYLAPYLADRGWDVTVYGRPGATQPDDPQLDRRVRRLETRGIESRSLSTLSYGLTSVLMARREKPDVALVMNVANGFWLPILRRAGIPTLVNVDGIEWDRAKWGKVAKALFLKGARLTAANATDLVYDARAIADRWATDFGTGGKFIPYGGGIPTVQYALEPGLEHRKYVLYVARFVPENSIEEFFGAVPGIADHADVVIVGSSGYGGELDDRARDLAAANDRVHWLGHVSDDSRLHSLWQHAGVYFHGHSVGGTNPALVQAMACGAPTVARDTVFNREVLGDTAVFVQPESRLIAQETLRLLSDEPAKEENSGRAQARAAEHYSWNGVNDAYERALTELVRASRTPAPV